MKRNKNTYTRQTRTTMERCGNNESKMRIYELLTEGQRPSLDSTRLDSKSIHEDTNHLHSPIFLFLSKKKRK